MRLKNAIAALTGLWGLSVHAAPIQPVDLRNLLSQKSNSWANGTVISFPNSPTFNNATRRWSTFDAPTHFAAVSPVNEADVVRSVELASSHEIRFLATGARHGYTITLGDLQQGLAIDLGQFKTYSIDSTVGTVKRGYLVHELGVPASHIFNSRDASFVQGVMTATDGRGVDVVINSLVGDLMHASWGCLVDIGRLVEIGKRELIDAGRLDTSVFLRNATFTAFDLSEFFYARDPFNRGVWDRPVAETVELYRAGHLKPPPFKVFDVANIAQAYRYFAGTSRVGKVVISLENSQSLISVAPATYHSVLDPQKVYLLVGCLGGLGCSLSRWMMARGARHFVFLGRSGCDKRSAQQLVCRLQKAGAGVGVVRGDVAAAVLACLATGWRIGGVVQAAMGLHEALFTRMPNKAYHTGIQPKWAGTWNLHNALAGHDDALDFFLLTSSVSGSIGTATERNYCSANGFLDAFARWRHAQGKPAVSVGLGMISEVGYLHENPKIEVLLLRKGIQPLDEQEFLQVVDLALVSEAAHDPADAHLLTGFEPAEVRELQARGVDVTSHGVLKDARTAMLATSLKAEQEAETRARQRQRQEIQPLAKM